MSLSREEAMAELGETAQEATEAMTRLANAMKKVAPLGARSRQNAAMCMVAIPAMLRIGMLPSERMRAAARWGQEHGVMPNDFRPKGLQ